MLRPATLTTFSSLTLALGIAACAPCEKSPPEQNTQEGGRVGGYSHTPQDEDTREAARFVVATLAKRPEYQEAELVRIESAAKQIVAGTNHHLKLVLKTSGGEKTVEAVVYHRLDGNRELTSVQDVP